MEGGTEAFPELGRHCQHLECNQLDFLPFKCDSCRKVFCLDHRSYKSHECPKSDRTSRKVIVCEICSASVETTSRDGESKALIMEKHKKSGDCDPKKKKKKKKPTCPVRRCREVLTFSNNCVCKNCKTMICLKHRFPADHACSDKKLLVSAMDNENTGSEFLAALALRNVNVKAKDCAKENSRGSVYSPRSVKAF